MNQNISLQMVDELGKAFDWHQISDFNCHQISVLSWYNFFFPVGLSHLILATPASCSPPHIILAKVGFKLWLILDSKKHFFFWIRMSLDCCPTALLFWPATPSSWSPTWSTSRYSSYFLFHLSQSLFFWNWVSYITSLCCCLCCPFKRL